MCHQINQTFSFYYCFRSKLHEGVIRDVERQKRRKMENAYVLQQQIDLTKNLRKELETHETQLKS